MSPIISINLSRSFFLILLRIFSIAHDKNLFHQKFYREWRRARIKKLLKIYNVKHKKILELGAGIGVIGKFLSKAGANVTTSDARVFNLKKIKSKKIIKIPINNDEDNWSQVFINKKERFNLIIHWGLLYHLYNWKADLKECLKIADYICLETIILKKEGDSDDIIFEFGQDQSANFFAKIPSQDSIEKYLKKLRCTFKRYDHKNLDVYLCPRYSYVNKFILKILSFFLKNYFLFKNGKVCSHNYSWNSNPPFFARRFWFIKNNNLYNKF